MGSFKSTAVLEKLAKAVISIACLVILLSVFGTIYIKYVPSTRMVPAFKQDKVNLVLEGDYINNEDAPKIIDGEILLPFNVIKSHIDKNIFWDEKLQKLTVTTREKVIRMNTENLTAIVNNKPVTLKVGVKTENNKVYVPVQFLSELYEIDVNYNDHLKVVIIDNKNTPVQTASVLMDEAPVRRGRSIREPILQKLSLGQEARVYGESGEWYKVRTSDGIVGYLDKKFVKLSAVADVSENNEISATNGWSVGKGKINMVWEANWSNQGIDTSKISRMEGLDIVSPTWFEVKGEDGTIISRAETKYMEWARQNGYKVWALFANNFSDAAATHKILSNSDIRDNMIRQILVYAKLYKLDGINIDFENVYKADKDLLTQFVREITPLLREQGLIVSMDVNIPGGSENYSLCYDHKAIGETVDYVMLMAYDQYWSTSPVSGSVAQITWVESNLRKVLAMVPANKLILGVPAYANEWMEVTDSTGKTKVSSKAISMGTVQQRISEMKLNPVWDEPSGQYYIEYIKEGARYRIWIEDTNSINLKSSLVHKYQLAGTSVWRRGFEVSDIWRVMNENLKNIESYEAWKEKNSVRNGPFQ